MKNTLPHQIILTCMNVKYITPFKNVITFNFFTRLSIARLANPSDSPPCRWHMRLCTILRQASADVGAFDVMAVISCAENTMQVICNTYDIETRQVTTKNKIYDLSYVPLILPTPTST